MIKPKILLVLLLAIPTCIFAQNGFSLKLNYVKPSGEAFATKYEPAVGFQFHWNFSYMEDQLQAAFFTGYYKLKPYNEIIVQVNEDNNLITENYGEYRAIPFGLVTDFKLFSVLDDKLSPILGADYFFERIKHSKHTITTEEDLDSEKFWVRGITFKAEVMYEINKKMTASIGLGYSFKSSSAYYIPDILNRHKIWDSYIKYKYYIN
ncbi:MAG: hypothetical protein R6U95_08125 [Bacteroidales bacterium]